MPLAPLCVPVEIIPCRRSFTGAGSGAGDEAAAAGYRWFRLALGIDSDGTALGGGGGEGQIFLRSALPDELRGEPLRIRLHLPPPTERLAALLGATWQGELIAHATVEELRVDVGTEHERAELRRLVLGNLDPQAREQLTSYTTLRTE
ncbi:MAG: hypothetical protein U1A78_20335 [Polyangia bacterium]